jgi:hypothetical protein
MVLAGSPWDEVDLDGVGLGIGVVPGDESPGEAAARVVSDLALNRSEWVQAGRQDGRWGQARLCRVLPERVLHVVGDSAMAAGLRELLAAGSVPGWHLNPVPVGRTPVHELAGPLHSISGSVRYYNLLARFGFVTIQEVAATPDACLLTIHQAGPRMVTAIRAVLGELGYELPKVTHPAVRGVVAERRALLRARLTVEHRSGTGSSPSCWPAHRCRPKRWRRSLTRSTLRPSRRLTRWSACCSARLARTSWPSTTEVPMPCRGRHQALSDPPETGERAWGGRGDLASCVAG